MNLRYIISIVSTLLLNLSILGADMPLTVDFWQARNRSDPGIWMSLRDEQRGKLTRVSSADYNEVNQVYFRKTEKADTWAASFYHMEDVYPQSVYWIIPENLKDGPNKRDVFKKIKEGKISFLNSENESTRIMRIDDGHDPVDYMLMARQTVAINQLTRLSENVCEERYLRLNFIDPKFKPIEKEIDQYQVAEFKATHAAFIHNIDTLPPITMQLTNHMDARLMFMDSTHCSVLICTKTFGGGAHSNSTLKAFNWTYRNGQWELYDPLPPSSEAILALSGTIKQKLNALDAGGNYFYEKYKNLLGRNSREIYELIDMGDAYCFIFKRYTVAAGAFGDIRIFVEK